MLAATASILPEMEAVKKRLTEVESQLQERTTIVGTLTQERDRLLLVETELNRTIQWQVTELSTLKRDHEAELGRLVATHTTTVEGL